MSILINFSGISWGGPGGGGSVAPLLLTRNYRGCIKSPPGREDYPDCWGRISSCEEGNIKESIAWKEGKREAISYSL